MSKIIKRKTEEEIETPNVSINIECGIIMPISSIDNCTAEHWRDVSNILKDAIDEAGFKGRIVSESEDSGIIQKKIIHNLYSDPIVVCDVSGKNPNVMFELGMRLAFDKPTIIVKDDKTDYSFDTSPIEHLSYPRDLRFNSILAFKEQLRDKIKATFKKSKEDKNYTTFLKHFGKFKVAHIDEQVIGKEEFILQSIEDLRSEIRRANARQNSRIEIDSSFENSRSKEIERFNTVNSKIQEYSLKFGIENIGKEININESIKDDLFKYLEKFPEIRRTCRSPEQLRSTMNFILETI